jgi:hypothetical protein
VSPRHGAGEPLLTTGIYGRWRPAVPARRAAEGTRRFYDGPGVRPRHLHWTQAPDQPTLGQAEPEAITTWHNQLVIVGSRGAPDNYIPSIWLSPALP